MLCDHRQVPQPSGLVSSSIFLKSLLLPHRFCFCFFFPVLWVLSFALRIESLPAAVEACSLKHWTAREVTKKPLLDPDWVNWVMCVVGGWGQGMSHGSVRVSICYFSSDLKTWPKVGPSPTVSHTLQARMAQPLGVSTPQLQVHLSYRREKGPWSHSAAASLKRGTLPLSLLRRDGRGPWSSDCEAPVVGSYALHPCCCSCFLLWLSAWGSWL